MKTKYSNFTEFKFVYKIFSKSFLDTISGNCKPKYLSLLQTLTRLIFGGLFSRPSSPPRRHAKFSASFPLGPLVWLQLFTFSAQVFFRVVFKGASSCFLSGYLPGPDKEVRLPAVSASTRRAAFSAARLTYTVKRLSQHWRSRLCVKRRAERGGDWKRNGFGFLSFIMRLIYA